MDHRTSNIAWVEDRKPYTPDAPKVCKELYYRTNGIRGQYNTPGVLLLTSHQRAADQTIPKGSRQNMALSSLQQHRTDTTCSRVVEHLFFASSRIGS